MLYTRRPLFNLLLKRAKTTVHRINSTNEIKRPTPILLLNTVSSDDLHEKYQRTIEKEWQEKLSDYGYSSYSTILTTNKASLTSDYQELNKVTSELSFFPPLLISFGDVAWRLSEKYVSNKPVSGYIMVDKEQQEEEPIKSCPILHEFEPLFPILMISKQHQPPSFLEGYIDYHNKEVNQVETVVQWLDDYGM